MKVDNFALTMFQTCPIKYFLRIKQGWTTRRKSAALGFGGTLHEGLATWYRTGNKADALVAIAESWPGEMPAEDWRTREKCAQVMIDYLRTYPQETFRVIGAETGFPMIETTFTIATGMYLNCDVCGRNADDNVLGICPQCGHQLEEIEYGGIFDGGVEFSGTGFALEHKTTSQLGDYYFNQFKPNNQVTGYIWALGRLSSQRIGGAIINAIGIYKSSPTKFKREITSRSDEDIQTWLKNVRSTCQMIRDCERRGYWPMFTPSCTMYGRCEFHDVHQLGHKEQEKLLEQMFVKEEWNYEHRDEAKEAAGA